MGSACNVTRSYWPGFFLFIPFCCSLNATRGLKKIFLAPAMNVKMWENKATQLNISKLRSRDFILIGPTVGELACGEYGEGRMASLNEIELTIKNHLNNNIKLNALVTAGPTREYIDPVRYLSNESSG